MIFLSSVGLVTEFGQTLAMVSSAAVLLGESLGGVLLLLVFFVRVFRRSEGVDGGGV